MTTQSLNSQTMELLSAYALSRSLSIRNRLVELNAGLVRQVAHRIGNQCSEPYEDLEQIGYIGLIRAIERFDTDQGCAFSSFAIPYIRGEMLHYLRDKSGVLRIPRRWQELYSRGRKLRKQLGLSLGRPPREHEIAAELGVSLQEWHECQLALQNRLMVSLDANVNNVNEGVITFGETLPDPRCQIWRKWEEDRLQLQRALGQLEEKTKAAIECVFLRDLPRKEAAKEIGISPMTVTRHLQKGIEQLNSLLDANVA